VCLFRNTYTCIHIPEENKAKFIGPADTAGKKIRQDFIQVREREIVNFRLHMNHCSEFHCSYKYQKGISV